MRSSRSSHASRQDTPPLRTLLAECQQLERERIARDIHDGVCQLFTAALLQSQAVQDHIFSNPHLAASHLATVQQLLREAQSELRSVVRDLKSQDVMKRGLAGLLRDEIARLESTTPLACYVDCKGDPYRLPEAQEVALLRMTQEALNNALRHAEASKVRLTLSFSCKALSITVCDNGKGFDTTDISLRDPEHLGIRGMRERAKLIGARVRIVSRPGGGTKIAIRLPVREAQENDLLLKLPAVPNQESE